jgi:hypothetical protein
MKQTICVCGIFYFKLYGIDAINKITKLDDIIYIPEGEVK